MANGRMRQWSRGKGSGLSQGDPSSQSAIVHRQVCSLFSANVMYYMTTTVATDVHLVNFLSSLSLIKTKQDGFNWCQLQAG